MLARAADLLPALSPLGRATDFLEDILEVLQPLVLFEGFSAKECGELCEYLVANLGLQCVPDLYARVYL